MSDLENLLGNLNPEESHDIDWDSPDAGQFPPIARPGTYDFVFHLRQDVKSDDHPDLPVGFDTAEINGTEFLTAVFDADVFVNGEEKRLTYQRVNVFKNEKMPLSSYDSLARSMGLRYGNTIHERIAAFQSISGRGRGKGQLEWTFFDKANGQTTSTAPRKRKNKQTGQKVRDNSWPRNSDGTFSDTVTDSTGRKQYGRAEFVNFFASPASEAANG
jgi:hypothetical protein